MSLGSARIIGDKLQMRIPIGVLADTAGVNAQDIPELLKTLRSVGMIVGHFYNGHDQDIIIIVFRSLEIGMHKYE